MLLVTDVAGDLGRHLVRAALAAGARRVYACAAQAFPWQSERVVPMVLDARSDASVQDLCMAAHDVTMLISTTSSVNWPPVAVGAGDLNALRDHFEFTVLGATRVIAALAPTIADNGGGVVACVESVQAWINLTGPYAVAQAGLWSAISSLRTELRDSGVHVLAAVGALSEAQHPSVELAAQTILEGMRERAWEILLDDYSASVRLKLSGPVEALYPELG